METAHPFAEPVRAMRAVGFILERPEQLKAYFGSETQFYQWLAGAATFFRHSTANDTTSATQQKANQWKDECAKRIRDFQDIAVGVASSNVATGVLSFVPVVGVGFALSGAIIGLSTMDEIEKRTKRMNEQLNKGCNMYKVYEGIPGLPEYISLTTAMDALPNEPAYINLCHGIILFVVLAAKSDIKDITANFMRDFIRTSDAMLKAMQDKGIDFSTITSEQFHFHMTESAAVATTGAGLSLLGIMGPKSFARLLARISSQVTPVNASVSGVASRFGANILKTTKVLRTLGKVGAGVALGLAINDTINACQVRDAAWTQHTKISEELDKVSRNLSESVHQLMAE